MSIYQQQAVRYTDRYGGTHGGFSQGLLLVLLLVVLAGAGTAWVSNGIVAKERWPVRWLEIQGSFQRVSAEQLRSSLAPLTRTSYFTVDLQELRDVALRRPWVADVQVQKNWPDTVTVTVLEHQPLAHWNTDQLVSTGKVIFAPPGADELQGLPWLAGPDDRLEEVLNHGKSFGQLLERVGLELERLQLDQRGSWSLRLNNGTEMLLGRHDAVARLERLVMGWQQLLADRPLPPVRVDLRYTNGFAVRWPADVAELAGTNN